MFCFRECLLLCVADHATAKFMLGKSQACLTYVVLQPRRNKYFSYFPSSTVRLMGVFFPASSHSLFLWAPFSFTQFDKRNRLFQITLLWTKISVSTSSPLLQYLQSHQGDLKKKKKGSWNKHSNICATGKKKNYQTHSSFRGRWQMRVWEAYTSACVPLPVQINGAGSKHHALHTCINSSANIMIQ